MSTPLPLCHLISTGGTIAMKVDPIRQAPVPALSGQELVAQVPQLAKLCQLHVQNLFNIPSDYVCPVQWRALKAAIDAALANPEVHGVIVTHGTDTLEETAWFLDLTLATEMPVVMVGAQRNASTSDFDGPRNLLNAVRICTTPQARGLGVMVAMNNQINAAREVTKSHTSDVEAFKSGDFGFLGVVDEDRVLFSRHSVRRQHLPLQPGELPRVEIVPMFCGASGDLVAAAAAVGARGIVVQALGLGNVNEAMFRAIQDALHSGVAVVISTRIPNGRVMPTYGFDGGGATLQAAGAVFADNLSPHKARILLMLALQNGMACAAELQNLFDR